MTDELHVEIVDFDARPTAVLREQTEWPKLGATIMRLLDRVWEVMRTAPMEPRLSHDEFGENIILYLDHHPTIEVGVLVDGPIDEVHGLRASELPAARVARAIHRGPYDQLGRTHEALRTWCRDHGHILTGVSWEHYGHWHEDPAEMETALCYVLSRAG